jgi:phosphoribosylanthranilate isomerase
MYVKICGITTPEDATFAVDSGADAVGMVVCSESLREVTLERAAEIIAAVGSRVGTVCVTHTASRDELEAILALQPTAIQISHDFSFPGELAVRVIRVLEPGDPPRDECDAVIVDASRGTGRRYDTDFARQMVRDSPVPVFLAGGLTPENVGEAIREVRPYAVDVCSGVEAAPGIKDREKVRSFLRACRG